VQQLKDFADYRLVDGCIYCGGAFDTRDHVPSRVLLDRPLPENLPVVGACRSCNNGFSEDEEYLACLLDSVLSGSTDPDKVRRSVVANILRRSPGLSARIKAAQHVADGQAKFSVEADRVNNVLLKLARGHAAYELSAVRRGEPTYFSWGPLASLSAEQLEKFEDIHVVDLWPEVGSRAMQRMVVTQLTLTASDGSTNSRGLIVADWVEVQEGRYRYLPHHDHQRVSVKIVIDEYLYCEAIWEDDGST
jgi:hypothetical protein